MSNGHLVKYLEYIENAGGEVTVEQFDEDWAPIGDMVRRDLEALDWINTDSAGKITAA